MTRGVRPRWTGRGLLLVVLLFAQLFMPAHLLGHELAMDSVAACAVCPVGQNLTGVLEGVDWPDPGKRVTPPTITHRAPDLSLARVVSFRSRAPPSHA